MDGKTGLLNFEYRKVKKKATNFSCLLKLLKRMIDFYLNFIFDRKVLSLNKNKNFRTIKTNGDN